MLESSGSMSMTGLTHPRPRTSETEGFNSQSSSPLASDIFEDFGEHGHTGSSWSLYLQVSDSTEAILLHVAELTLTLLPEACAQLLLTHVQGNCMHVVQRFVWFCT